MASFVHLAPEGAVVRIRESGIRRSRTRFGSGVYAMPVLPSYYATHQWLRELKRKGHRVLVAVQFRLPDDEPVLASHYTRASVEMTAAEAVAMIAGAEDQQGYEVLVPRKILPGEIHAVRNVPQVVGWRYFPGAHGRRPCACRVCVPKGDYGGAKLRRRFPDEY